MSTMVRNPHAGYRWIVRCVSATATMVHGVARRNPDGYLYYDVGPLVIGGPIEDVPESHWPPNAVEVLIEATTTPGMYLVRIIFDNSRQVREMLEDGSVFHRYGFNPPTLGEPK